MIKLQAVDQGILKMRIFSLHLAGDVKVVEAALGVVQEEDEYQRSDWDSCSECE